MDKEIAEQFEELGIEPTNEVLEKCYEICLTYNIIDPVEFVEQWMAYSISNLNGAEPTVQYLLELEKKQFANKKETVITKNEQYASTVIHDYDTNSLAIYGVSSFNDDPNKIVTISDSPLTNPYHNNDAEDYAIMDSYICNTPKANKASIARTPASKNETLINSTSYSPITGTPRSHTDGSGKIVYTFGNPKLLANTKWTAVDKQNILIKNLSTYENEPMNAKSKYLFDSLIDKIEIHSEQIFNRGKKICEKYFGINAVDYDLHHPDMPNQEIIKTIGTIYCEHDGKLDANSAVLIASDEMRLRTVRLNFEKCKSLGIFPGQTVLISGTNTRGDIFNVEQIFSERILETPNSPNLEKQISFVICSGPYTNYDDLLYDPLQDLLSYCISNKPNVLIMTGPFMEAEHTMIYSNVLAETFELFFEKLITGIVEKLSTEITICIISSNKDANSDCVYPTPPMSTRNIFPNVHMLSDPCIIDINGIKIGITSTDIVNHLLSNELFINAGDKIKRITNYLLHQGSFYPMNPPADGMCLDSDLANKFAKISQIPNLLILPSDQKCFIRECNGCLTINPGRLTDNKGGTFARLIMHPSEQDSKMTLFSDVACQVMKV